MKILYKMNFSPRIFNVRSIFSKIKINKLYCRNFLFTILIFDLCNKKNISNFKSINFKINIFKKRKHVGSFLRAPYKNKKAQFSLGLNRYFLSLSFNIFTKFKPNINNINNFKNLIIKFLNSYNYFESTLVTQVSREIKIPILLNII